MTQTEILGRLAEHSRQIEEHRTAIWLLEQQQSQLRELLIRSGWQPPASHSPIDSTPRLCAA